MKRILSILSLLLVLITIGCSPSNEIVKYNSPLIDSKDYIGYQPLDPIPVLRVTKYNSETNTVDTIFWKSISDSKTIRDLLPIQSAQVVLFKNEASGKLSFLTASLSGESGSYQVIMDYMKYRIEEVNDSQTEKNIGNGRIGIGLRIKAVVVTSKANINIGSLGALGLEASLGNLSGGISVDIIGMDSKDITNLIPLTAEINQTSIQSALQALASIKSRLWEDDVTITPHLIAIQKSKKGIEKEKITNKFLQSSE